MDMFKVGDIVERLPSAGTSRAWTLFSRENQEKPLVVSKVGRGYISLNGYVVPHSGDALPFDENNFRLVQPEPAQEVGSSTASADKGSWNTPSWDYAEAERLRFALIEAAKAYTEYLSRKPTTQFLSAASTLYDAEATNQLPF